MNTLADTPVLGGTPRLAYTVFIGVPFSLYFTMTGGCSETAKLAYHHEWRSRRHPTTSPLHIGFPGSPSSRPLVTSGSLQWSTLPLLEPLGLRESRLPNNQIRPDRVEYQLKTLDNEIHLQTIIIIHKLNIYCTMPIVSLS